MFCRANGVRIRNSHLLIHNNSKHACFYAAKHRVSRRISPRVSRRLLVEDVMMQDEGTESGRTDAEDSFCP